MKKFLIVLFMLLIVVTVHAEETVNLELEWIPNMYYSYEKDGMTYWGQLAYAYVDGKIAYCLDIYQPITKYEYTPTEEIQENNLVVLAGYFGYGYNGEYLVKDYVATQKLIWEYLGMDVKITSESGGKGYEVDIYDNILKIIGRINRYALFPKFDSNFIFDLDTTNQFRDLNNISDNFNIINDTNNNIYSIDNNLVFETKEEGVNSFYLQTRYDIDHQNIIFVAPGSQKIMTIGEVSNLTREYSYEVLGNIKEEPEIVEETEEPTKEPEIVEEIEEPTEEPEIVEETEEPIEEPEITEEIEESTEEPEIIEEIEEPIEEPEIVEETEEPIEEPEIVEEMEEPIEEPEIVEETEESTEEPEIIEEIEEPIEEPEIVEETEEPIEEPEIVEEMEEPTEEPEIIKKIEEPEIVEEIEEPTEEPEITEEPIVEPEIIEEVEEPEIVEKVIEKDKLPFLGVYYEKIFNNYIYFIKFNWMY